MSGFSSESETNSGRRFCRWDGLEPFTRLLEKEGEILRAENHHGSRSSAERSYLYNEASFPLSPPIEKLDILLPWIMHTEGHRKIPLCIREIEREIREHTGWV